MRRTGWRRPSSSSIVLRCNSSRGTGPEAGAKRIVLAGVIVLGLVLAGVAAFRRVQGAGEPDDGIGAFANPTGSPLGGGEGYAEWVPRDGPGVARTKASLLDALADARAGDVVYVDDGAEIDLTSLPDDHEAVRDGSIVLRAGVTLASGRGRRGSPGAFLNTRRQDAAPLFRVLGSGVRVTGLRIEGPDTGIEPSDCGGRDATGIEIRSRRPEAWTVEIDNNELYGWPHAAVAVRGPRGPHIHHNHIHHNRRHVHKPECARRYGFGYGVRADTGRALIEANVFDHNRHDIASDGSPGAEYEARYNLILDGGTQHSFDVHAHRGPDTDALVAGRRFRIHHNTFLADHVPAVHIREKPIEGAWIYRNEFRHGDLTAAVRQSNDSGNVFVHDNAVGANRSPPHGTPPHVVSRRLSSA